MTIDNYLLLLHIHHSSDDHSSDAHAGPCGHHHPSPKSGLKLLGAVVLNLIITIAEVVGGIWSGSLALISDALHNLSDTASLATSYVAHRIAGRRPNARKTFGYRRAEIIGAFVNLITLILIALFLIKEAVERFLDPQPVDGPIMLVVAIIGLLANVGTALLLFREARHSLNIRSAYLHIITDALSSVGVVIGGILIWQYGVYLLDPILTVFISLYIIWHAYGMLKQTLNILMEGTPAHLDVKEVVQAVEGLSGVQGMHHVHAWQLDEAHLALEAHVLINKQDWEDMEAIKQKIKHTLKTQFGVGHSTLEFEFDPCAGAAMDECFEPAAAPEPMHTHG